ncbi:Nramp family divalent metal transporter [Jeotgalicoccus sp. ATCC 8456]|uniref:Nramp family divalent metal transporter n=1 Tax=Jeotgalicoccus sp. ATCC 8456 TaxID=946435 RepID=UPI0018E5BBA7|nr:Nramp family divalent metal transporter [Jeotgalicoccus sp. ATCC 8456]QQD84801.1 Nramp family divalent metal transporter [Jeotgalicoccus sp. ATCC 8456]
MWEKFKTIGPGMLVAGAFVGTGTITTSIVAGTENGYTFLWASVTAAIVISIILQEMTARLSMSTGKPLAVLVKERLGIWASIIVILAIVGGNSVYSVGNLSGVNIALGGLFEGIPASVWIIGVTFIYWSLLMIGKYNILEKIITILVALMGILFLINMFYVQPDYVEVVKGLIIPTLEIDKITLVIALIGTTVVPYNFYLHSTAVLERGWHKNAKTNLGMMRFDTIVPIFIGGIITMSIGVVAGTVLYPLHLSNGLVIEGSNEMAMTIEPLLGKNAYALFSLGLFAAAISSMPMAALSAAYVFTQSFGLNPDMKGNAFRLVFSFVAWVPVFFAVGIENPIWTIILAQSINGMLLPITAILVLYLINKKDTSGSLRNNLVSNILGYVAVGFTIILGLINIISTFQ